MSPEATCTKLHICVENGPVSTYKFKSASCLHDLSAEINYFKVADGHVGGANEGSNSGLNGSKVVQIGPKCSNNSRSCAEIKFTKVKETAIQKNAKSTLKIKLVSTSATIYCIVPETKWSSLLLPLVVQRLNLEYVMACLSTLGGAHSSLGENSKFHAKLAGMMSVKQLAIAAKLDNPILASHCRLYYAHSLIQTGTYKTACHIIRKEFKFATSSDGKSDEKSSLGPSAIFAKAAKGTN
eukprot:gene11975-13212_t